MERYEGDSPKNCRVKIQYGENKPKVTFKYPDKENQHQEDMFLPIFSLWAGFAFVCFLGWYLIIQLFYSGKMSYLTSIFWIFFFLLPPFLIYYPFEKKWKKIYPKFMALLSEKKEMVFYPQDVNEKNYVEVPMFDNIFLKFKTQGEFGKYLKEIEIEEYKFKYLETPLFGKEKRKVNEWIWYARFHFAEKPQIGRLEVIFA
jgi:hypothetical protein